MNKKRLNLTNKKNFLYLSKSVLVNDCKISDSFAHIQARAGFSSSSGALCDFNFKNIQAEKRLRLQGRQLFIDNIFFFMLEFRGKLYIYPKPKPISL